MQVVQAKVKAELNNIPDRAVAMEIWPNQTPESASSSMSRMLKSANVRDLLADALEKYKITPDSVVKTVAAGMRSTKPIGEIDRIYDEEGNLIKTRYKKTADHGTRLKAAAMAAKFMGIGEPDAGSGGLGGIHFHQHIEEQKKRYDFTQK